MPPSTIGDLATEILELVRASKERYATLVYDNTLGDVFHITALKLPAIEDALQALLPDDPWTVDALRACKAKAEMSLRIFTAVADAPDSAKVARYRDAVTAASQGVRIEDLVARMMLDLMFFAQQLKRRDQSQRLAGGVGNLGRLGPSLPPEDCVVYPPRVASGDRHWAIP